MMLLQGPALSRVARQLACGGSCGVTVPPALQQCRRSGLPARALVRASCALGALPVQCAAKPSRRALLVLLPALLTAASARAAEGETENPLGEGQPVRPALPAAAYMKQLRLQRPAALAELRRLIEAGDFSGVSAALFIAPFDDVRQAAFYLPWAVVATNQAGGTELENRWIALRAAWKGIDDAAISAARFAADEAEVTAALDAFVKALDEYEAAIPAELN